jgi:hypothetical protein
MKHLTLQTTLKFTVDDLKANRDGRVSKRQFDKYKPPEINKMAIWVLLGHGLVIGGILGAIAVATGETAMWLVFGIVVAAAFLPFVLLNNEGNLAPALRGDVLGGKVAKTCGIVVLTQEQGRDTRFDLYVDGVTLKISRSQAAAFVHGEGYCVYYLPNSLTLLSAEPL